MKDEKNGGKTEELSEKDLNEVQGGLGNFEIQDLRSRGSDSRNLGRVRKPGTKNMEWVHEDE